MRKSWLLLLLFLSSVSSVADQYHYKNLLVGGDAIGFGGAYTSLTSDLSVVYYNPAALSFTEAESTASINSLAWEKTRFKGVFNNDNNNNVDFFKGSFGVVPGYFAIKGDALGWYYGLAISVLDYGSARESADNIYDQTLPDSSVIKVTEFTSFDTDNAHYRFDFAVSQKLFANLSLGAGISLDYQQIESDQSIGVVFQGLVGAPQGQAGFTGSRRLADTNIVARANLAMLWQVDNFNVGMKLSLPEHIKRQRNEITMLFGSNPFFGVNEPIAHRLDVSFNEKSKQPRQAVLGLSYRWQNFLFTTDWQYYSGVDYSYHNDDVIATPAQRKINAVHNYAAAIEYKYNSDSALRLALFTDNSNGVIDPNINFQRVEDIDLTGVSISVKKKLFGKPVSFGFYYKHGSGDVRLSDLRLFDALAGSVIYPPNDNFDIYGIERRSVVTYFSLDY